MLNMPRMRGAGSELSDGGEEETALGRKRPGRGPRNRKALLPDSAALDESAQEYTSAEFEVNELVLARNPLRQEAWWPVIHRFVLPSLPKHESKTAVCDAGHPASAAQ